VRARKRRKFSAPLNIDAASEPPFFFCTAKEALGRKDDEKNVGVTFSTNLSVNKSLAVKTHSVLQDFENGCFNASFIC